MTEDSVNGCCDAYFTHTNSPASQTSAKWFFSCWNSAALIAHQLKRSDYSAHLKETCSVGLSRQEVKIPQKKWDSFFVCFFFKTLQVCTKITTDSRRVTHQVSQMYLCCYIEKKIHNSSFSDRQLEVIGTKSTQKTSVIFILCREKSGFRCKKCNSFIHILKPNPKVTHFF